MSSISSTFRNASIDDHSRKVGRDGFGGAMPAANYCATNERSRVEVRFFRLLVGRGVFFPSLVQGF